MVYLYGYGPLEGLRAAVAAAAERGGFVLLAGEASVGKTRSAAEAATGLSHPAVKKIVDEHAASVSAEP